MADLLTLGELSVWVREDLALDDAFALATISAASLVVTDAASQPDWDTITVPPRAALIAAQLAKRTYLNPDAETSFGLGPISGRTLDDFARTLELTPVERAILEGFADVKPRLPGRGHIFTLQTENRPAAPTADGLLYDTGGGDAIAYFVAGSGV